MLFKLVPKEGREYMKALDEDDDVWWLCVEGLCMCNFASASSYSAHAQSKHDFGHLPPQPPKNPVRVLKVGDPGWRRREREQAVAGKKYQCEDYRKLKGSKQHRWNQIKLIMWREFMYDSEDINFLKHGFEPEKGVDAVLMNVLRLQQLHQGISPWACLADPDETSFLTEMIADSHRLRKTGLEWRESLGWVDKTLGSEYVPGVMHPGLMISNETEDELQAWQDLRHLVDMCKLIYRQDLSKRMSDLLSPLREVLKDEALDFLRVEQTHAIWVKDNDRAGLIRRARKRYFEWKLEKSEYILRKLCRNIIIRYAEDLEYDIDDAVKLGELDQVIIDASDSEEDKARYRSTDNATFSEILKNGWLFPDGRSKAKAAARASDRKNSAGKRFTRPSSTPPASPQNLASNRVTVRMSSPLLKKNRSKLIRSPAMKFQVGKNKLVGQSCIVVDVPKHKSVRKLEIAPDSEEGVVPLDESGDNGAQSVLQSLRRLSGDSLSLTPSSTKISTKDFFKHWSERVKPPTDGSHGNGKKYKDQVSNSDIASGSSGASVKDTAVEPGPSTALGEESPKSPSEVFPVPFDVPSQVSTFSLGSLEQILAGFVTSETSPKTRAEVKKNNPDYESSE